MVDIPFTQIGVGLGGGAVAGTIIGFAFKKLAKLVAVVVGLELATFKFLEMRGLLEVDWNAINGAATDAGAASIAASQSPPNWMTDLVSSMPLGVGATGGFLLGFSMA